jgi:hypothetical protein
MVLRSNNVNQHGDGIQHEAQGNAFFKLLSNELWLIVLAHFAIIYLEYFLTLLPPYGTILDGTGQLFKGTYKFIPCQRINGFAVVGYLFAINSGHCILTPHSILDLLYQLPVKTGRDHALAAHGCQGQHMAVRQPEQVSIKSGTFVQKLHCDAREKFTGNNELIKTHSARTSRFKLYYLTRFDNYNISRAPKTSCL